ncbi:MAG: hypothetical protein ACT4NY_01590 [Pseudonocardiales bacterium]
MAGPGDRNLQRRGLAPLHDPVERGALLENLAAATLHTLALHSGIRLHYWRDRSVEVDLVFDHPTEPMAFEIEYKPFDTWGTYGRTVTTSDIPGSGRDETHRADQPVRLTVSSPCARSSYRTRVHAEGEGPVNETTPRPIPFEVEDTGWTKISAQDCAGGA